MKFIDFFTELNSIPLSERIKSSILFTNQHLLEIDGKCNGIASTMSLFVWEYENQEFHMVNIGDSRIYKITKKSIQCLTTDDAIKRTKTIITSIGKRVVDDSYLINFVGNSSIKINIERESIEQNDLILIATDGFYDARKSSFEQRVMELYDSNNLENDFLSLVNFFEMSAKDDMTAIIIKNEKFLECVN